ncbi:PAS domain-containing protein [Rubripirellula amarantea]|nr:PAS domain-containing protein [Rubripirellula amarantea]
MPLETEVTALLRHSQYRSAFEQLLTSLSTRFINLPIDSIDEGIDEALGKVGNYTGVDRCFVYQYADETRVLAKLTHEWCAAGVPSIKSQSQDIRVTPLAWAVDQLSQGKVVHITDVADLPADAEPLRQLFKRLGVRSAFYLPLLFKHGVTGMLGFSCISHKKVWSDDSIALLRVVGEVVVNAMDRKQDFTDLKASQERYKSVVEDQTDFIVRWRPDGSQTFINGAICRWVGKPEQEILKRNVYSFIHPDDLGKVQQKLAMLTPDSPAAFDEHRVLRPDGTVAWHEWSDRALFDEDGKIVELQSVGRDITAQRQAREELEYRQRLESLILNLTLRFINLPHDRLGKEISEALRQVGEFIGGDRTSIYIVDQETKDVTLSFEWLAPGAPPTPAGMRNISTAKHDWAMPLLRAGEPLAVSKLEDIPPSSADLRALLESTDIQSFISVPILLDQELFAFMSISSAQKGKMWSQETASILRLLGEVFVNALVRKTTEEALAASEERLSLTIDAVADGFYDWDIPNGWVYVSDNWLVSRQHQPGNNRWIIDRFRGSIHPDDRPEVEDRMGEHLAGRTGVFECEYRVQMADGTWRWSLDRGRVISRDDDGTPLRMVGVDRDITDEVQSRQRLEEADARLAHLARVATMGEVVAGIAHEVNQPLHAAATFANAATAALENKEPGYTERVATMIRRISSQMNRAADIIRRLRNFTRPSPVRMSRFDLNALVHESAEMVNFEAKRKHIRVKYNLDESLPRVVGDRVQIQQVIVNLLRNAFDSFDTLEINPIFPPHVTLETGRRDNRALLLVSDNGAGLAEGVEMETLFDAFITSKVEGMGMGLALCRSIVTSHHGKIWGESNGTGGMTFSVLLPVEPEKHRE